MKNIITQSIRRLLFLSLIILTNCSLKNEQKPPNIVFIMGDDIGVEVLGSYGGTSYKTPNLDALAKSGIQFNHCYSTPVCSPSRVKLMTGRYGFRTGQKWGYIPPEEITFGHVLKSAGYKVGLSGKWQMTLLKDDPNHISKMGFDESCVFGWHEGPRYFDPYIYENGKIKTDINDKYGPDIFCDYLIDFIVQNKDKPFFAYYPMTLAHEISNDLETPPPPAPSGKYQSYKELVEYMDKLVGRVVNIIDSLGLRENTLIMFVGDNGTPSKFITEVVNGEYISEPIYSKINGRSIKGGKSKLTDAGTHVPLIANWLGKTPSGTYNSDLIDFSDFMPTFAELATTELPKNVVIDGNSFVPQIYGKKGNPRTWAYNEWEGKFWIRTHRWKLYDDGKLFDMENDQQEKHPIMQKNDSLESASIRNVLISEMNKLRNN